MHLHSLQPTVSLSDKTRMSKSTGSLDSCGLRPILEIMLIVLNILASARRSGCLAADVFSAS